jgi:HD-GYP domain-containing protein (c-di-GMP phosphodiesterase class II)
MEAKQTKGLTNFIRHLATAAANASLYTVEHQHVNRLCAAAHAELVESFGTENEISFLIIENELVVDGIPLPVDMFMTRFGKAVKSFGLGHIRFKRGIRQQELQQLVAGLTRQNASNKKISSTEHIRFGRIEVQAPRPADETADMAGVGKMWSVDDIAAEGQCIFREIQEGVRKNRTINISGIVKIVNALVELCNNLTHPFQALASLLARDEYTFVHSSNVCILNLAQAMALGIDGPPLYEIGIGALLHDIGKLFIPEEILNKPGALDDVEMEIIRQHPAKGALYLLDGPDTPRMAVITAFEHHMKYDYSGYPKVGSDWQQNLCSQMTTISDFFDALRTRRPYKEALEFEVIKEQIVELAGKEFNPALTEIFLHLADTSLSQHGVHALYQDCSASDVRAIAEP